MRDLFQAASTVPLVVEGLAHATELERGLRAIFKCYVQGNFAPAETVRLADRSCAPQPSKSISTTERMFGKSTT
jgi:hypothetical protein